MTDEQLTEIEKRVEAVKHGWDYGFDGDKKSRLLEAFGFTDIPALIARVQELEAMLMDHVKANEVGRDLLLRALPCVDAVAVAEECQVICGKKPTRALADNIRAALGQNTDTPTWSASWLRDGAQFEHRCRQAGLTKEQVEAVIKAVDECV